MRIPDKVEQLRAQLGLKNDLLAVNAGTWGPMSSVVHQAMRAFAEETRVARIDAEAFIPRVLGVLAQDRTAVARFLGCTPEEIALCESTTTGLNIFLWGLPLRANDEIVQGGSENPAAQVPLWVSAQRKGLRLKVARPALDSRGATDAVLEAISPQTRLVLVSHVNYVSGARVDLAQISARAHAVGAKVLVDGVQAAGTCPIELRASGVDGYALARHKFLCGPDGAGALFLKRELLEEIAVTFSGACSDAAHGMSGRLLLQPSAERYELSTRSIEVSAGAAAALDWFEREVGAQWAHARSAALRSQLWDRLQSSPRLRLLGERDQGGALLTFQLEGRTAGDAVRALREQHIHARTLTAVEPEAIRLSIGFWTRDEDVPRIARAIAQLG